MAYLKLEDLSCYQIANTICDVVWEQVEKWDYFAKDTLGKQYVRSVDSIVANISEGFGRYYYLESIKFYYYARGSVFESQFWCKKAIKSGLIAGRHGRLVLDELRKLPKEINKIIKITRTNSKK